ncbi:hypothetical protein OROGR_002026 [Orobanche gracilis]
MASLKAEKPLGPRSQGPSKKAPAKGPASKQVPVKGDQKPGEPKKKVSAVAKGGKK